MNALWIVAVLWAQGTAAGDFHGDGSGRPEQGRRWETILADPCEGDLSTYIPATIVERAKVVPAGKVKLEFVGRGKPLKVRLTITQKDGSRNDGVFYAVREPNSYTLVLDQDSKAPSNLRRGMMLTLGTDGKVRGEITRDGGLGRPGPFGRLRQTFTCG